MRVAISCDENPGDPGTTADPTITERDLNIAVASHLLVAFKRCGIDAWFDPTITFTQRLAQANSDGTDLLFACAHNAGGGQGMVAIFCPGGHQNELPTFADGTPNRQDDLAGTVGDELFHAGIIEGSPSWHPLDESVDECCLFNRNTAYIEFLFMDSAHDQAIYHRASYASDAAEASCRAVCRVFGLAYIGPAAPPPPPPPPGPAPVPPIDPARALALIKSAESTLWAARNALGG